MPRISWIESTNDIRIMANCLANGRKTARLNQEIHDLRFDSC